MDIGNTEWQVWAPNGVAGAKGQCDPQSLTTSASVLNKTSTGGQGGKLQDRPR
jgi:hypothetical protein